MSDEITDLKQSEAWKKDFQYGVGAIYLRYKKWIYLAFLSLSFLCGYLVFSAAYYLSHTYDLEAFVAQISRSYSITSSFLTLDGLIQGLAFLVSIVTYILLARRRDLNHFLSEVIDELMKVVWPPLEENITKTWIVIVLILISSIFLGLIDYFWTQVVQWIL